MILRRLSQSLKQQNWTAIWIEFVLLVAGVFLGIQVANWNTERETRHKSVEFTARVKDDLLREGARRQSQIAYYQDVRTAAEAAADALSGKRPLSNEAFLINAYRATQYLQFPRQRATYDELISTGNIGLIQDRRLLRLAVTTYVDTTTDNLRREKDESPYRAWFRGSVANDVQRALARQCGDRITPDNAGALLDYPCQPGLEASDIDAAAVALRDDPQTLRLLRLRLADIETQLSDIGRNNGILLAGLAALEKKAL